MRLILDIIKGSFSGLLSFVIFASWCVLFVIIIPASIIALIALYVYYVFKFKTWCGFHEWLESKRSNN